MISKGIDIGGIVCEGWWFEIGGRIYPLDQHAKEIMDRWYTFLDFVVDGDDPE